MLLQIDGLSLSPVKVFSILIFHLLIHLNRADSQVVGPHQPVVALVDDDVILPCHVEPAEDVTAQILEWTRSDLNPRFVHVWRSGQDLVNTRNPSYRGRTSLFSNELKQGNISLKLSRVKLSDGGTYECSVPLMEKKSFVKLVVASDAATSPVISLSGIDKNRGGVVLQCESAGWYPEPELLWLDGEGNLLSAGPTETLRGPDDLYTVSSRVTVEKRHSNSITCRVQQKEISQSRDTHIHVAEDFFEILSSSSSLIIGLAVTLALCIMLLILSAVVLLLRKRKHMMKNNRSPKDPTDVEGAEVPLRKDPTDSGDAEGSSEEARETEQLNTSSSSTKTKKQTSCCPLTSRRKLLEEQQRREEAEKNLKDIKAKLQQEKKDLKKQLEEKNHELSGNISQAQEDKQEMEREMERLRNELESTKQQSEKKTEIIDQLQEEKKTLEELKNQFKSKCDEMIKSEKQKNEFIQKLMETFPTLESKMIKSEIEKTDGIIKKLTQTLPTLESKLSELISQQTESEKKTEIINQLQQVKEVVEKLKNQLESKNQQMIKSEIEKTDGIIKKLTQTLPTLDSKLSELISQQTEWKKNTEIINQLQEVKETVKKLEQLEKKNQALQCKKDDEIIKDLQDLKKQTSKNQEMLRAEKRRNEETDRKVKELVEQLEKEKTKTEKKLNELVKQLEEEKTEQQMNKLQKGDIILDKVDGHAPYICLRNTSSEDKMMTGWELKLQINNRNPVTYTFERNFTLKARKGLTLHRFSGTRGLYPDNAHLRWADMSSWNSRDNVKINFMSNTGEEHRLM